MATSERGSVLFGAPADAFKATKKYCLDHDLPFPRELVAPQELLVEACPQFNPEFFLYDFLFIYGAAFKPELEHERLRLVVDSAQTEDALTALRVTLTGTTREEMQSYRDAAGRALLSRETIDRLASVGDYMAIKKGAEPRPISDMVDAVEFDSRGEALVLDGTLKVLRTGPVNFELRAGSQVEEIDLTVHSPVIPFATLPPPADFHRPVTFAVKPLGTRSGFDLSGPTTGFFLWVNGRAVIYDGPVGTRYLLESQGISPADIEMVILSHCHEDHMGAFVELFLAGYRPKVVTTEPIYRSALMKLSGYFRRPPEEVASLIEYRRVAPGTTYSDLGASFDFFYTVHSIPTVGVRVSVPDSRGRPHSVQISGDNMHHDGLNQMLERGVITDTVYAEMRNLVPQRPIPRSLYFADVGESLIHGHPRDWADNPNQVIYYHCPDNEHTRSFGKEVAHPGGLRTLIEPRKMHPSVPGRVLNALKFLDLNDPGWFQTILFQGRSRTVDRGEVLISPQDRQGTYFTVIVSGTADVTGPSGAHIARLRPGEFFGVIELVDRRGRVTATVTAETPMELFEIDAHVFHDYIERQGLRHVLDDIWTKRPLVESARIFRRLDTAVRNQIARVSQVRDGEPGAVFIEQDSVGDSFFLLLDGEVEILVDGRRVATIRHDQPDNFFGEISAVHPTRRRNAEVRGIGRTRVLEVNGRDLRHLFENHMGIRYSLMVAIRKRA
jgi:CRP-like cAMP-binding protein